MALVSILVPAFNEEKTISQILARLTSLKLGSGDSVEVIVIDDGSTDRTAELAESQISSVLGKVIRHSGNRGKGAAVRTGLSEARGQVVIVQDADLEYDPADIENCVRPILDGQVDVVYGSRRLNEMNRRHSGWLFFAGGVLVTTVFNLLYGYSLTDEPTCYKAFRKELLDSVGFGSDGFEWEPEVTAKLALAKTQILEVPISYNPRARSDGKKITWRDGFKAIGVLIAVRIRGHSSSNTGT